jgi:hypothetical protein
MDAKLSGERFRAARAFVDREGRPLDQALLRHHLGEQGPKPALEALAAFQNEDGGFGHGLEPDTTSPASTAIATSIGLRLLVRLGAAGDLPMVRWTLAWLDAAIDRERGVWAIVGPDVELAPHAPWWSWSEDLASSWNGFRFNPTAEILAWLYRYADAAPSGLLAAAEAGMRRTLAETDLIEGAYDLKCAVRLAEAASAPDDLRRPLIGLVRRSAAAHDPGDEHASAFDYAATPGSLFADVVADRLERALDQLIAAQEPDGGWPLFWDWSFVDAAAWEKAKRDWRGWLTREALEILNAYGRVEA